MYHCLQLHCITEDWHQAAGSFLSMANCPPKFQVLSVFYHDTDRTDDLSMLVRTKDYTEGEISAASQSGIEI